MVRMSGIDTLTAWRTGLLLAVGGEFCFTLLTIALESAVIDVQLDQIVLASVFFFDGYWLHSDLVNHVIASQLCTVSPRTSPIRR